MAEKGHGKAMVNFTKRAKRVQEKMMQKLGKSDQTKDEVFEEFVNNFNKQHAVAVKLQRELAKYMNALRLLNQSTHSLSDVIEELYEAEWEGRATYKSIVEKQSLLWEDKLTTLQSMMVEPMSHYVSRFPEEKSRIHKRERKVVDFDLTRRALESIKAKPKVTDQKIQQAEESYTHAKQLYDEITDQLYDELPTFYDSRIQFYASLFQSLATTEAKFHSEISKVDEELAELMDSVASQAATGVHSTKKERSVADTGPRLLSRPGEESETSSEGETHPPVSVSQLTDTHNHSSGSSPISTPSTTPTRTSSSEHKPSKPPPFTGDSSSLKRQPPSKPVRSNSTIDPRGEHLQDKGEGPPEKEVELPMKEEEQQAKSPSLDHSTEEPIATETTPTETDEAPPTSPSPQENNESPTVKTPPPKPEPMQLPPVVSKEQAEETQLSSSSEPSEEKSTEPFVPSTEPSVQSTEPSVPSMEPSIPSTEPSVPNSEPSVPNSELSVPSTEPSVPNTESSTVLFKVIASHPYQGEDEDELTFEKGEVIQVIPYDDPDDEEEGWYMGIVEGTNRRGIFPANFTKREELAG